MSIAATITKTGIRNTDKLHNLIGIQNHAYELKTINLTNATSKLNKKIAMQCDSKVQNKKNKN